MRTRPHSFFCPVTLLFRRSDFPFGSLPHSSDRTSALQSSRLAIGKDKRIAISSALFWAKISEWEIFL